MRRARIKAVATVPSRRRINQEISVKETGSENTDKKHHTEKIDEDNTSHAIPMVLENVEETKQTSPHSVVLNKSQIENSQENNAAATSNEDPVCTIANNLLSEEQYNTENTSSVSSAVQSRVCFAKPMPRLNNIGHVRRISAQGNGEDASESEEDNRKNNSIISHRLNNETMPLLHGNKETLNDIGRTEISKLKDGPKRRVVISESARKLAEARREFYLKHENKTPDRSKLTMYDLIYYNPVTNPMRKSKESATVIKDDSLPISDQLEEEENEDDSSTLPVPQVKVGPDGLLIIDEKSLVIEQSNAKKTREVMKKQAIIDDDNSGSGFYKRRQKSKDWSKWETLKFYKALNTVGTDFLLMQSLFPNRTRQDIKLKFKKEEKVNRKLVEKALVYHQEFDIEMLEKELAIFHEAQHRQLKSVEKIKQLREKNKKSAIGRKRARRLAASSIDETDASENDDREREQNDVEKHTQKQHQNEEEKIEKPSNQNDNEVLNGSEGNGNTSAAPLSPNNDSSSETEVYQVRPTRSGRLPKIRKLQGPDVNMFDSTDCSMDYKLDPCIENTDESEALNAPEGNKPIMRHPTSIKNVIPDINQVEPGSLVILTKESSEEPGKTVLQVYMVSSNTNSPDESIGRSITPVNLSPDLLATVTNNLIDIDPLSVKDGC